MRKYSMPAYGYDIDAKDLPIVKRRLFRKRLVGLRLRCLTCLLHVQIPSMHVYPTPNPQSELSMPPQFDMCNENFRMSVQA